MSEEKSKGDKNAWLWWLASAGFLIPIGAAASYAIYFWGQNAGGPNEWGTFGDFIGGLSNPLLSFLTIILLVVSLRLQAKELKESSEAVKQSAEELKLTRKIYQNQETLQLRNEVRPQIREEFNRRIKHCNKVFDRFLGRTITFNDVVSSEGDIKEAFIKISPTHSTVDIETAKEDFHYSLAGYQVAVGSLVDCAASLIAITDSDVAIYPIIWEVDDFIHRLVRGKVISFLEANNKYYFTLEKAINARLDKNAFPPLHTTNISLMARIDMRRHNNAVLDH